jgi:hypothetical protein
LARTRWKVFFSHSNKATFRCHLNSAISAWDWRIAKSIVDAHQGQIRAESSGLGTGAIFTVSLPLAEPQQILDAQPPRSELPAAKKAVRILLVDDREDTWEFTARCLTLCGHQVDPLLV